MVWVAYPWRDTRPLRGTTAIEYQDGLAVRLHAGAVAPGFLLGRDDARPHVERRTIEYDRYCNYLIKGKQSQCGTYA